MSHDSRTLWFNPEKKCWEWQETRTETRQTDRQPSKPKRWISPNHAKSVSQSYARAHVRGPLTDKKITKYEKLGRYTAEYREARRKAMKEKQQGPRLRREGGCVEVEPGRWIYSPL